jgi:pyrroloquinoline-quinone synthase
VEIIQTLDRLRAEIDVLDHPFYVRWVAGDLEPAEIGLYAGQYGHAVVALARCSALAARTAPASHRAQLERHAREEESHVELWRRFDAGAGGGGPVGGAAPLAGTTACVRSWEAGETLLEHLAVLYVLEGGQPQIAATKLEGLVEHYGYAAEGPATEYFRLHRNLDVEHARQARELIGELAADAGAAPQDRMAERAREALSGNWALLDAVEAARPPAS